jgi:predicted DNA-binding transcriptional regulator AlpA
MFSDDVYYDTKGAAELYGCSESTLQRHRAAGTGPRFQKLGPQKRAPVRYRRSDLLAWLEQHTFTSTAEYGRAP